MYELLIIWVDGDRTEHYFDDYESARNAEHNYKLSFGTQIAFTAVYIPYC